MAITKVTPVPEKITQLRAALDDRFAKKIWMYTMNHDGTITLQTVMDGILRDIVRTLEREGFITG